MDPKKLFEKQLKLARLAGIRLSYKGEGKLTKFLVFYCFFFMILITVLQLYILCTEQQNLEDLAKAVSNVAANIETIVGITSFYVYRKEYQYLISEISDQIKKGLRSKFELVRYSV